MRHAIRSAITLALALACCSAVSARTAQQKQPPQKGRRRRPRPSPTPRSPSSCPAPLNDPSFEAFRKQLGEIAAKKDRAGLAKLVVTQGFFWDGEKGDQADKKKSGIDNLATAIGLAGKQPVGWDMLQGYAQDPTATAYPGKQGVICAPPIRNSTRRQLEELAKTTGTDPGDWAYPLDNGVEVRSAPRKPMRRSVEKARRWC